MNSFYEWLYKHYAEPEMDEAYLDPAYHSIKKAWLEIVETLSPDDNLTTQDYIGSLKLNWGALAFHRGVEVGLMLYAGLAEGQEKTGYFPSPRSLMI